MTTLRPTSPTDLTDALDVLEAAAGTADDDTRTRAVLAVAVQRLEQAAGACLGPTDGDPLVVLQRRLGRAHALLSGRSATDVDADLLRGLARALQPARTGDVRPLTGPSAAAALAGC